MKTNKSRLASRLQFTDEEGNASATGKNVQKAEKAANQRENVGKKTVKLYFEENRSKQHSKVHHPAADAVGAQVHRQQRMRRG